ncbi:hypothetical protein L3X38_001867 [Prunus dulcis]|uniref:Uncharacterized protein n=1 Tax=Prunus dulcis TaxID=3755 RepID=A0AAD4WSU1_PRUDU|nr:hypothetical protein L3X38_001867 [Prunus dulcis]
MQQGERCRMAQDFTYSKDHSSRLRVLINRDPTCQPGWNQIHGGVKFIQLKSVIRLKFHETYAGGGRQLKLCACSCMSGCGKSISLHWMHGGFIGCFYST